MQYEKAERRASRQRLQSIALMAILIVGIAARGTHLFSHSTSPDEAFTFFIAAHPLHQIIILLQTGDFHPPLLYLIGHALFYLTSRAYLFRLVMLGFAVVGIAATYALTTYVAPRWALSTALLVAVCPVLVFFDRFFRMYAMLWPLCMASWALLVWSLSQRRVWLRWLLYAVTLVLLLYTQYLAFFTVAAQMLYVALGYRRTSGFWFALGLAGLAFVPWLPVFAQQYPLGGSAYNELRGHLGWMTFAPSVMLIDGLPDNLEYSPIVALALWLLLIAGIALAILRRQWLALALCAPIGVQVLYSIASGKLLLGQRYLLQGVAPVLILVTLVVAWLWSTRARLAGLALAAVLLCLMLFGTVDELFLAPYQPIDWTAYGHFLDGKVRPGDAIIFDGAMAYYTLIGTNATKSHVYLVADNASLPALIRQADAFPRIWYVDYQSHLPDPQHLVFTTLARSHPHHQTWSTTQAGYGDVVLTTLFVKPRTLKRGP